MSRLVDRQGCRVGQSVPTVLALDLVQPLVHAPLMGLEGSRGRELFVTNFASVPGPLVHRAGVLQNAVMVTKTLVTPLAGVSPPLVHVESVIASTSLGGEVCLTYGASVPDTQVLLLEMNLPRRWVGVGVGALGTGEPPHVPGLDVLQQGGMVDVGQATHFTCLIPPTVVYASHVNPQVGEAMKPGITNRAGPVLY